MKQKKVYVCTECDYQSPKWLGKCPSCGAWNTFTEETYEEETTSNKKKARTVPCSCAAKVKPSRKSSLGTICPNIFAPARACRSLTACWAAGLWRVAWCLFRASPA
ncbi:MAG: hypothetical protein IJ021_02100 [Clostridia bacterium]|nr:hypothetical protein [Clostridia bacterium]